MPEEPVHLVEPTMQSASGHCFSLAIAMCEAHACETFPLHLWIGRDAGPIFPKWKNVEITATFTRRLRRLQAYFIFRRLLRTPGRILLPTATMTDVVLLNHAIPGRLLTADKLFLYVHWFRETGRKMEYLRKVAKRHPGIVVLSPTESVVDMFARAGFPHTRMVPYPLAACHVSERQAADADYGGWLYPGAARVDKGFPQVAGIVGQLAAGQATDPITIHSIPDHSGRYQPAILTALEQVKAAAYPHLTEITKPLVPKDFQALFPGKITLQPYNPVDFTDRVSCVTLDALRAGSPLIVPANTWIERQAKPFDACISLTDLSAESFLAAARAMRDEWPRYHANALRAGAAIRERHDPIHLLNVVRFGLSAVVTPK